MLLPLAFRTRAMPLSGGLRPMLLWGAGAALAEIGLGLIVGQFFARGRAEVGVFLLFRPVMLVLLATVVARRPARARVVAYGAMLAIATLGESGLLAVLGGREGPAAVGRGLLAGVLVAVIFDILMQAGVALGGRAGRVLGSAAGLALLLIPGVGATYRGLAVEDGLPARGRGGAVEVLSGLPLIWGEGAIRMAGPQSSAAWRFLDRGFTLRPVDRIAERGAGRLLLIQPRAPTPTELVAIDRRIRAGARALILTDPLLRWPSERAFGDPAGPPRVGTLGPLLAHWGLALAGPEDLAATELRDVVLGGERFRLMLETPGRFVRAGAGACRIRTGGLVADCAVGRGRVLLLADADLLRESLWSDGQGGASPSFRRSDNAAFVAALLAKVTETRRPARPVAWF